MRRIVIIVTLALGLVLESAAAQRSNTPQPSVAWSITGGLLLGGLGLVAGTVVGFAVCPPGNCRNSDDQVLAIATILLGESLGMALGVHLGNRRLGSFPLDLLAAGATGGAGLLLADAESPWTLVAIPVTQLATTAVIEHVVGRARRASRLSLSITPPVTGSWVFAARVVF